MADVKFSEFDEAIAVVGDEELVGLQGGDNIRFPLATALSIILGYKSYNAILSQTGTSDPSATVLKNELSGAVVWTRSLSGRFIGTLIGEFTNNKTVMRVNTPAYDTQYNTLRVDSATVELNQKTLANVFKDEISNLWVEIRVYY